MLNPTTRLLSVSELFEGINKNIAQSTPPITMAEKGSYLATGAVIRSSCQSRIPVTTSTKKGAKLPFFLLLGAALVVTGIIIYAEERKEKKKRMQLLLDS